MEGASLDTVVLALFDLAQNQKVFERLEACRGEESVIRAETARLRSASDSLEREIIAFDERRASASKLLDAAFPPEAKQAAEKVFMAKFDLYFNKTREALEKQLLEARALELNVVQKFAAAQKLELEQIAVLKGKPASA
jgi:hypothetical protein